MSRKRPIIGIPMIIAPGSKLQSGLTTDDLVNKNADYLYIKSRVPESVWENGGAPLLISPYMDPEIIFDTIDGLLIPGGDDIPPKYFNQEIIHQGTFESDRKIEMDQKLIHFATENKIPTLGICYGMQIINVALGGDLIQDLPTQRPSDIEHGRANVVGEHYIKVTSDSQLKQLLQPQLNDDSQVTIASSHHQAVGKLGRDLIPTAIAPDELIEAIEMDSNNHPFMVAVQWHPEWDQSGEVLVKGLVDAASRLKC